MPHERPNDAGDDHGGDTGSHPTSYRQRSPLSAELEKAEAGAAVKPTIVVRNGEPVGGIKSSNTAPAKRSDFRVDSERWPKEVHVHGYDLLKDVPGGRRRSNSTSRPKSKASSRPSSRARRGADRGADGEPVTCSAVRARAGFPAGPADPGLALRLGGFDRPDRLLLRALGSLAQASLRAGPLAAARSGALARPARLPTQVVCGAIGVFLLGVAVYSGLRGTEAPDRNFALTFLFVTSGSASRSSASCSATSFGPSTPGGRSAGSPAAAFGRSPASAPRTSLPGAAGPLAGRGRPARVRLAGGRLRHERSVAVGLNPDAAAIAPSSTAPTRWR